MAGKDITGRVEELLEEFLEGKDLELYRVIYKKEGSDWVLRVFIDKTADAEDEYVSIEDCEAVNGFLSTRLDELDLIDRKYNLEVSSPGLDRELLRESDYVRFAGRQIEVRTYEQIEGVRLIEGILAGRHDGVVSVDTGGRIIDIPEDKISKINLAVVF